MAVQTQAAPMGATVPMAAAVESEALIAARELPRPGAVAEAEVTVRFIRSYDRWNRGVSAGFTASHAALLIARGKAVRIGPIMERDVSGARMVRK